MVCISVPIQHRFSLHVVYLGENPGESLESVMHIFSPVQLLQVQQIFCKRIPGTGRAAQQKSVRHVPSVSGEELDMSKTVHNADSLLHDLSTNNVESFNSFIKLFSFSK